MSRRLFASTLPVALAALLVAGSVQAQPDSTSAPATPAVKKGNLFTAVSFAKTGFGKQWSRLRAEAQRRYPDLQMTRVEDLHVTVVYVGAGWTTGALDSVRALARVVPPAPVRHTPEVVHLGRSNHVVAVELHGESTAWGDAVVAAKAEMNRLGLKRPEGYDTNFRPHITLAQARSNRPSAADSTALAGFRSWMTARVAEKPGAWTVTIGPATPVLLLLAGATRPEGAPEYVTVEEFLARHPLEPSAK